MSKLKRNLISSYLSQAWSMLMNIAFIPVYIHFLGVEAYGLIGFYALLLICFSVFDMGLSPTVSREVAIQSANKNNSFLLKNMIFSFEVIILFVFLFIGLSVYLSSDWLSTNWITAEKLNVETISTSIALIGWLIGLRLIESFYRSIMIGLQEHVLLSLLMAILATVRSFGAIFIMLFYSQSIIDFFSWQLLISFIYIVFLYLCVKKNISPVNASFSFSTLLKLKKFASSMMLISILMLLLTQMDKIVLSKLVSLEQFGYYTLAASIAAVLLQLMTPITQVYYPLLTRLIVQDDKKSLIVNFHTSSRIVSVFIVPFSIIIFFFAKDLLLVWTRNAELTDQTYQILQILIIGNALNCVIQMPYFLQLANGHTSWGVRVSLVALLFSIPATIFGSIYFGVIGAASVWLIVNLLHFVVSINFITEPIFIKQKLSWYFRDVLSPFFIVISCVIMFIHINPFEITSLIGFLLFSSFFICLYLLIFCIFLNSHFKQLLKFGKN